MGIVKKTSSRQTIPHRSHRPSPFDGGNCSSYGASLQACFCVFCIFLATGNVRIKSVFRARTTGNHPFFTRNIRSLRAANRSRAFRNQVVGNAETYLLLDLDVGTVLRQFQFHALGVATIKDLHLERGDHTVVSEIKGRGDVRPPETE